MPTSAPGHAAVTDRQGRLTLSMIDDVTNVTTSTSTTTPLTFVSRLTSNDNQNDTKVDQVVEIGTNGIVGGVANLGEFKGKFQRSDTSSKLLGLLTGKKWTSGTQTWNYYDLSKANFDYVRLIADPTGNVYMASVGMSAVLNAANFDFKNTGMATEEYDFQGPQLVYINGFPIVKVYNIVAGDVSAGLFSISTTLGANEAPNPVLPPGTNEPPNSLYSSGRCSFLKVTRVPSATATINGSTYAAGSRVRYYENQPYKVVAAGLGTIGSQTVTPTVLKADGTTMNYVGPELVVGASIVVDVAAGSSTTENCTITAVTSTTISFTTTKTHSTSGIVIGLAPTSGQVLYNPLNKSFVCGDTLVSTDTWRFLFASYGTNSVPSTIGTTSLDTQDPAGVPGRLVPISISAYSIPRCTGASIKVSIARKQVQGIGEGEIVYGTAGVPKIDYSIDVIATDNSLLMALQTGSTQAGAGGDIYSADYTTRYMLANNSNFTVTTKSPASNSTTIKQYVGTLPVFTSFAESGSSGSEMTYKMSGQDYSGALTITAYS